MTDEPIPADLAGFQQVMEGEVQEGDLLVYAADFKIWATSEWYGDRIVRGVVRDRDSGYRYTCAVYRRIPVAKQGSLGHERRGATEYTPENAAFSTGAQRSNDEGRGRFDLIPYEGMLALAQRFELGCKYGERNWEHGQPLKRLLSSMRRHAMQLGEDDTEDHAAAVAWNAIAYITTRARIKAGKLPESLAEGVVTP